MFNTRLVFSARCLLHKLPIKNPAKHRWNCAIYFATWLQSVSQSISPIALAWVRHWANCRPPLRAAKQTLFPSSQKRQRQLSFSNRRFSPLEPSAAEHHIGAAADSFQVTPELSSLLQSPVVLIRWLSQYGQYDLTSLFPYLLFYRLSHLWLITDAVFKRQNTNF